MIERTNERMYEQMRFWLEFFVTEVEILDWMDEHSPSSKAYCQANNRIQFLRDYVDGQIDCLSG